MLEKQLKKDEKGITQSNLISRAIYKCTPMARKLIAYSMKQFIMNSTTKDYMLNVTIAEFLDALNLTKNDKNYLTVKNSIEECLDIKITITNSDEFYEAFNWFSYALYDQKSNKIKMQFSQPIAKIIKNWKETGYSYINLSVIGLLKNIYSIRWYELSLAYYNLKNNYGNWQFSMTIEEIKRIFGLKDFSDNHFVGRYIEAPIEQLNKNNPLFEITIEKEWYGQGKKVVGVILHCQERKTKLIADKNRKERDEIEADIDNLALQDVKQNALEVMEEKKRIENIKSMHLMEYIDLLKAEYEKTNSSFPPNIRSSFAESNAVSILLEKYKDE